MPVNKQPGLYPPDMMNSGRSDLLPLLIIGGLSAITIGITKVYIPLNAVALEANEVQLGYAAAAMPLGMMLMSFPAGKLLNRLNPRCIFSIGISLACLFYLIAPLIHSIWGFIILMIMVSATLPLRFVIIQKKFLLLMQHIGSTGAGWLRATQMLGAFVVGPTIAGLYLGIGSPGDMPFIIVAILVLLLILSYGTRGIQTQHHLPGDDKDCHSRGFNSIRSDRMSLRSAYFIESINSAVIHIFNAFCVIFVVEKYGLSADSGTSLIIWQGIGFAGVLLVGGRLLKQIDHNSAKLAALTISLILLMLMPSTSSIWQAKLISITLGSAMATLTIINMHTFSKLSHDDATSNRIATMSVFVTPLGGVLGTIVSGYCAKKAGVESVYYLSAILVSTLLISVAYCQYRIKKGALNASAN